MLPVLKSLRTGLARSLWGEDLFSDLFWPTLSNCSWMREGLLSPNIDINNGEKEYLKISCFIYYW